MSKEYIFGSKDEELQRLAHQHQVWMKPTHRLWEDAGIKEGDTVLDIGCGPGFATLDLSYKVGKTGKVVAFDKSEKFISYLKSQIEFYGIENIEVIQSDLSDVQLPENTFDHAYSRWVFSWVNDPELKLEHISKSLKSGAKLLMQEYNNWHSLEMRPYSEVFETVRTAALKSWDFNPGDVNIAKRLPNILSDLNYNIESIKPLSSIGRPGNLIWQWVTGFLKIYSEFLIEKELMTKDDLESFKIEIDRLEKLNHPFIFGPQMLEIIAIK